MKYVSVKQMRFLDKRAIKTYGIPAIVLMENAGASVAREALKMLSSNRKNVAIFCGRGNNGGDGLVAARHLANNKKKVDIFFFGDINKATPEVMENLCIVQKMRLKFHKITSTNIKYLQKYLKNTNLIIDALLGTGTKGNIEGLLKEIITIINHSSKPVLAVDIPSGLDADTGLPSGVAVKATKTVTLGLAKKGFLNLQAKYFLGKIIVADIGLPLKQFIVDSKKQ